MPFATFSDDLAVFDSEEPFKILSVTKVIDKPQSYGNITWSGDAVWLTVTPSTGPVPIYKLENKQLITYKYVDIKNVKSALFLNWMNRNIIFGLDTGEINIWNIKEKRVSGTVDVQSKESVNFLTCNLDDTCIASGSLASNEIGLHSLRTNKFLRSLTLPEGELTSSLRFCQCKKGYLAASTSASTICVWDVIKPEVVFETKNAHLGACSGLEFSPLNFSVLATVSLSQQLKLYDLRKRDRIFDVHLSEPLHCVDMFRDGDKVAVGTGSGTVIVYDLRANKIFATLKAHNSAVNAISINKLEKLRKFDNAEIDSPDTPLVANRTLDLSVIDVFSPIVTSRSSLKRNSSNFSSPFLANSMNDAAVAPNQNDSFLSKILSPNPMKISSPLLQSSSIGSGSYSGTPNGRLLPVLEEGPVGDCETPSDGTDLKWIEIYMEKIQSDIQKIEKEQEERFKLLSDQLIAMEDEFIRKLQTNYDQILEFLLNIIKRNLEKVFFEMRYELVSQRVLHMECFNMLIEKTDNITCVLQQLMQQFSELRNAWNNI